VPAGRQLPEELGAAGVVGDADSWATFPGPFRPRCSQSYHDKGYEIRLALLVVAWLAGVGISASAAAAPQVTGPRLD